MSIICMAVYSTEENKKDECLEKTLTSIQRTVNLDRHKLRLSVNGKTQETENIIERYIQLGVIDHVIYNPENLGTAEAINKLIKQRNVGESIIKMDDDIVIHQEGWVDILEEIVNTDPSIGQAGLKRKDCIENPLHPNPYYRSELRMLNHIPGHKWLLVEQCSHVMGSCVLHSSALLDKVGYLFQPETKYGFDDVLMSKRSLVAGFKNVFYPHIEVDHIDDGKTPYQGWKERTALERMAEVNRLMVAYADGTESIYYNPFQ